MGAGLVGEVGVALRCSEDEDSGDGVPEERRAPGETEKLVGLLKENLASSSLHTAKLRLKPSAPPPTGGPNTEQAASEPLASSWQRSTKLPRRTDTTSRSALEGRGLEEWVGTAKL